MKNSAPGQRVFARRPALRPSAVTRFFVLISFGAIALVVRAQESPNFLQTNDFPKTYQPVQVKLGFNLGWDSPYSAGLECAVLFHELVDVNAGVGIGISGAKVGGGLRYYPLRKPKVSPMLGMLLFRSTGVEPLALSNGAFEATYALMPQTALLTNAGFRLRFGHGNYFTVATGYVFTFSGDRVVFQRGSRDPAFQTAAELLATGGFSLNVGIQVKLTKGHYFE